MNDAAQHSSERHAQDRSRPSGHWTRILLRVVLLILSIGLGAQTDSTALFGPPVDIEMKLSGNFGEIRRNHFHTGIDIKTQGVQGKNILSIADGHVSRVRVSTTGYGLALYIDHPSGHTSVYGHLSQFNAAISAYVEQVQYAEESWTIDHYPEAGALVVSRGEVIALSGNSGSSSGPHLHFEIRDTESEHPLNALDLGYEIEDTEAPIIQGLRVYPTAANTLIDGQSAPKSYTVRTAKEQMQTDQDTILVSGEFGLALHTYDKMGNDHHKYGVYRLEMMVDGETRYAHRMRELDFETFRYVNTHCDYGLYKKNRWRYHKCFLSANNQLDIYEVMTDRGRMTLAAGEVREVLFRATDIEGNERRLSVILKGEERAAKTSSPPEGLHLRALADNVHRGADFVLQVPAMALYDDCYLPYSVSDGGASALSRAHRLDGPMIPIQEPVTIKLRPTEEFADSSKLLIADRGNRLKVIGGEYRNGWLIAKVKDWGNFLVLQDLTPPNISSIDGLQRTAPDRIDISASDELSGIVEIRVEVDGRWLLMEHNRALTKAHGRLSDLDLQPGSHTLSVRITDAVGNVVTEVRQFDLP